MKKWATILLMATLYWPGTQEPIKQYEHAKVVSGKYKGLKGRINFVWADGSVDFTTWFGMEHYFIEDYHVLRRTK